MKFMIEEVRVLRLMNENLRQNADIMQHYLINFELNSKHKVNPLENNGCQFFMQENKINIS